VATPIPLACSHGKKKRNSGLCALSVYFRRASPSSGPDSLTTSLILEFHRREWDRVSPDSAVVVGTLIDS